MKPVAKTTKEIQRFLKHEIKIMQKNLSLADQCYIQAAETGITIEAYRFLLEWTTGVHG